MHRLSLYGTTGPFTRRMLAAVLFGQSICVFFGALVARAIAATGPDSGLSTTYLVVGSGLAVLSIVAASLLRRPFGVTLGWVVQVLTLASAVVVSAMLVVGLIFLALWIGLLIMGSRVDEAQGLALVVDIRVRHAQALLQPAQLEVGTRELARDRDLRRGEVGGSRPGVGAAGLERAPDATE